MDTLAALDLLKISKPKNSPVGLLIGLLVTTKDVALHLETRNVSTMNVVLSMATVDPHTTTAL
jgi:hypothetical protein